MPQIISRRDFLVLAGFGAGAAALAPSLTLGGRARAAAPTAGRVLVVLDLAGGNDGLSMAPPVDMGALLARRANVAYSEDEYLRLDNGVMLHPSFQKLQHRAVTLVDGVGASHPDFSHFEMLRRWWAGDPEGTAHVGTGFLGRLCDALDEGAPATGVSIGSASSPALISERAGTIGLPDPGWLWWFGDESDQWSQDFHHGLSAMSSEPDAGDSPMLAMARRGLAGGVQVGELVASLAEGSEYPGSEVGTKLALTSQLIGADIGIRVFHVAAGSDYDTHEDHRSRHSTLMTDLDDAIDAFLVDLESQGLTDRVLIATTSEFGRRPEENGSGGLDHGAASVALLAGAVGTGRVGEAIDLEHLDDDDNFVATTSMNDYYATLAAGWFGVSTDDLLHGPATALTGVW